MNRRTVNMELHRAVALAKFEVQAVLGPAYSRTSARRGSEESVTFEDQARRYAATEPPVAAALERFHAALNAAWTDAAALPKVALGRWVKTRRPHGGLIDADDMLLAAQLGLRRAIVSCCDSALSEQAENIDPTLYVWWLLKAMCAELDAEHVRLAVPAEVPEKVRREPGFATRAADMRAPGESLISSDENSDE